MIRLFAPYLIGAAVFAFLIGGAVYVGVKWERDRRALDDAQDYIEGTEDARDAENSVPADDSLLPGWLRDFANGR